MIPIHVMAALQYAPATASEGTLSITHIFSREDSPSAITGTGTSTWDFDEALPEGEIVFVVSSLRGIGVFSVDAAVQTQVGSTQVTADIDNGVFGYTNASAATRTISVGGTRSGKERFV